jgi:phosphoglycerol transferase MdoB-like AlkP superfamily enzyme
VLAFVSILLINRFSCTKLARWQIFFYIVIFTMAIGAFWEIYEYLMDTFLASYLTKPLQHGLDDTMMDLISDLVGGLVVALLGTWYIERKTLDELTSPMVSDSVPECDL